MTRSDDPGRRLDRREVFRGRIVAVSVDRVRMPDGREVEMELVRHPGSAAVLPIAETADGGEEVLLLRQYRYATGGWLLEIPAGKLDPGESAADCARRELAEETGWAAGEIEPLGEVWPSPGVLAERIALFVACGLTPAEQSLEDDELLTVERLPLAEAVARAASGELEDAKTVCALLRLAARRSGLSRPRSG
ncbi:MAG TPA: NUDIX hydrolase [Thermoanaerobaculia bacterium]